MKHTKLIITIVGLSVALFSTSALAQGQKGPRRGKGPGLLRVVKQLNLSAVQHQQITALRTGMRSQITPLQAQLRAKRGELRALWQSPTPNRVAILGKQQEITQIRHRIQVARTDFRLGVLGILNPQQRQQLQQMTQARRQNQQAMRRGGGGGQGQGMGQQRRRRRARRFGGQGQGGPGLGGPGLGMPPIPQAANM